MNRYTIIVLLGLVCLPFLNAKEQRDVTDADKVFVDWVFSPEVSTFLGFNLDTYGYGLEGKANIDLKSTVHKRSNEEFMGQSTNYGKIVINDFEISLSVEDAGPNYDSSQNQNKNPLSISWSSIEGWVFIGPVFLKLGNVDHDKIRYVSFTEDSELAFTNIAYSVLPPYYSASYLGRSNTNSNYDSVVDINNSTGDKEESINNDFVERSRNQISIGLSLPEIINVEIGYSTMYSYLEEQKSNTNPYDVSLLIDLKAVEHLMFKLKANAVSGRSFQSTDQYAGFLREGNPLSIGVSTGYTVKAGRMSLTPKLGAEVQLEELKRLSASNDSVLQLSSTAYSEASNDYIFTTAYEIALGISADWKNLGYSGEEHLSDIKKDLVHFSNRKVKLIDGISLVGIYGSVPFSGLRELNSPYLGLVLSMWESEEENRRGILNKLGMSFVANFNYVLGNSLDIRDHANKGITASDQNYYSEYKISLSPRMDLGLASEVSYSAKFIKPYLGVIFKFLDFNNSGFVSLNRSSTNTSSLTLNNDYVNQMDLRTKFGFQVINIINNTSFIAEWQSGDIFNTLNTEDGDFDDYDYFKNNVSKSDNAPIQDNPRANLGYIKIGAKISF